LSLLNPSVKNWDYEDPIQAGRAWRTRHPNLREVSWSKPQLTGSIKKKRWTGLIAFNTLVCFWIRHANLRRYQKNYVLNKIAIFLNLL
jgi:hypothetical protein